MFKRGEAQDKERVAYHLSINVSGEKTIFKQNNKINRGHFWEIMMHTRKSIHKEKVLSILNFIINEGGGVHAPSACGLTSNKK